MLHGRLRFLLLQLLKDLLTQAVTHKAFHKAYFPGNSFNESGLSNDVLNISLIIYIFAVVLLLGQCWTVWANSEYPIARWTSQPNIWQFTHKAALIVNISKILLCYCIIPLYMFVLRHFFTLFATTTICVSLSLSQWRTTVLSVHPIFDLIFCFLETFFIFDAKFTTIWVATSSNLGLDTSLLVSLDFLAIKAWLKIYVW